MNASGLRAHLTCLDAELGEPVRLCIYGSAALMLLGQEDRFSVDVDVAAPYSAVNLGAFEAAAQRIGLPVNPTEDHSGDHIEWVGPARLCLARPTPEQTIVLWQGARLTVFTLPPADLIASRLIRYDPIDQADIQFLMVQARVQVEDVAQAVQRLPPAFRADALVKENLGNLRRDAQRWLP